MRGVRAGSSTAKMNKLLIRLVRHFMCYPVEKEGPMMEPSGNERTVAEELISFANRQGVNLEPLRVDGSFQKDGRSIWLWRKDELPCSGPANQREGTLNYNMQGTIAVLPDKLKASASAFRGAWSEAGSVENVDEAFKLMKAWLIDKTGRRSTREIRQAVPNLITAVPVPAPPQPRPAPAAAGGEGRRDR